MDAYYFEHMLAFILVSSFGQILLHKIVIYLCSTSLTVYIVIQNFHSTGVSVILYKNVNFDWFSRKNQFWNRVYIYASGLYTSDFTDILGVKNTNNIITSSTTLFKRDLSTFLRFTGFPFLSLPVHPESFAINYIKFNFPPTVISHFFHQDFRLTNTYLFFHLLCPLIIFHTFPHYSLVRSGPISTLFIIIMSHCASRHIRPSCCLANTFRLVQPLWLLPCFSAPLYFALSQLSFSK